MSILGEGAESRRDCDVTKLRKDVISNLSHITVSSREFYDSQRLPHAHRLQYGRLSVAASEAIAHLLHDMEIEDLEKRVEDLEEKLK